ncbi:hypothetical protein [Bacillus alveayuensis]|jgi:hypothetical protein|uniref:hypothetical protein n=1 Tax=Aeribacillus alveayuensis TaxID=279215 RepID=UPI0005CCF036|nr:hypothetical protein [Bacillus alveayuensis]
MTENLKIKIIIGFIVSLILSFLLSLLYPFALKNNYLVQISTNFILYLIYIAPVVLIYGTITSLISEAIAIRVLKQSWITTLFFYLIFSFLIIITIGDWKILFNNFTGFLAANSLLILVCFLGTIFYWAINFFVFKKNQ